MPSRTAASVLVRNSPQLLLINHCLPQLSIMHHSAASWGCGCFSAAWPLLGMLCHKTHSLQSMATSSATCFAVFFKDFVEHVSALCRVLRQPQGNALLVGVGGSGKQTLAHFAAHLSDVHCFQIQPSRG